MGAGRRRRTARASHVVSEYDRDAPGAARAEPAGTSNSRERVAFVAASRALHGLTARTAPPFWAARATSADPAGLGARGSAGQVRPRAATPARPCRCTLDLAPGERPRSGFLLGRDATGRARDSSGGSGRASRVEARRTRRARDLGRGCWARVQVARPIPALDLMVNRWLLYQTCRLPHLGPASGFYQSGGAFGFRDQLQDCWRCCTSRPPICARPYPAARRAPVRGRATCCTGGTRRRAAACARAARTTCSGCLTSTAQYVEATGDRGRARREGPVPARRRCAPGEDERYCAVDPGGEAAPSTNIAARARTRRRPRVRTACR